MLIILYLIIGFIGLVWSANHLVRGASSVANYYGISPLIIGLTIVALGTSAPEIFVSYTAAMQGKSNLAIGNAIGSNIANIGLVLGVTALINPLKMQSSTLRREYPLLFIIMLFAFVLMIDGHLSVIDGSLFLLALCGLMIYLVYLAKSSSKADRLVKEFQQEMEQGLPLYSAILSIIVGMVVLPLSSKLLVYSASEIALWLGVSELVIGLTIVAIGTSLPEIATSLIGAYKGEDEIAIGNILGSNMFNLLAVLIFPGLLNPSHISTNVIIRDIPTMFLITIILFVMTYKFNKKEQLNRSQGILLLIIYISYMAAVIYQSFTL
jgi:cation:H+ antiporter